jgi:hypothetical protein
MSQKVKQNMLLICECNKVFNSRTTLWRDKKKCIENNYDEEKKQLIDTENNIITPELIVEAFNCILLMNYIYIIYSIYLNIICNHMYYVF